MRFVITTFLLLLCVSVSAAEPKTGTLKGRFVYDGEPPKPVELKIDKDPNFCGKTKLYDESLIVDAQTRGIANVVVELVAKDPPKHPDWEKLQLAKAGLSFENCRLDPHVSLVLTKQEFIITNRDEIGHNAKLNVLNNYGNCDLLPAGYAHRMQFRELEPIPVLVTCSIHPWLNSYLIVRNHPYVSISNATGEFSIPHLPPGEWTFRVWQEKTGFVEAVTVKDKVEHWAKGKVKLTIAPGENDLGEVKVSPKEFGVK